MFILANWDTMEEYMCFIPRTSYDGAFYRAVFAVHSENYQLAQQVSSSLYPKYVKCNFSILIHFQFKGIRYMSYFYFILRWNSYLQSSGEHDQMPNFVASDVGRLYLSVSTIRKLGCCIKKELELSKDIRCEYRRFSAHL